MQSSNKINLTEELELRARLRSEFDRLAQQELGIVNPEDIEALAQLLAETIEQRKVIEKNEAQLKTAIKKHIPAGGVLDARSVIVLLDSVTRRDLDKEKLKADFGADLIERQYTKESSYEKLTVKRKGVVNG